MPKAKDLASLDDAVESYNSLLLSILDKHAPKQTVIFREGKHPWWSSKCHEARRSRRAAGLKYRKDRYKGSPNLAHSHQVLKEAQVDAAILLNRERNKYYREKLSSVTGNAKETYKVVNKLLDKEYGTNKLPNGKSDSEIANGTISEKGQKSSTIKYHFRKVQKFIDKDDTISENGQIPQQKWYHF